MPLNFKVSGGGDFKSVPAGSHIAVCNMVVDIGLQPGSLLYPDPKHKVYIRFETPNERVESERDGRKFDGPQVVGATFTASMHEKANLRKQLEGWRGRKFTDEEAGTFDVASILGKPCMLNVVETVKEGKVYTNIASISPIPKGVPLPEPENPLILFTEDVPDSFQSLPEWLRKKINERILPKGENTTGVSADHSKYDFDQSTAITDDDIPF